MKTTISIETTAEGFIAEIVRVKKFKIALSSQYWLYIYPNRSRATILHGEKFSHQDKAESAAKAWRIQTHLDNLKARFLN